MPAVSASQQRLFGAAEHGATFPAARRLRATMTHAKLREFAATTHRGLPDRVRPTTTKKSMKSRMLALRGAS